jgi:hypothetical protein
MRIFLFLRRNRLADGVAQVVEHLLSKSEALSSNPSAAKKTKQVSFNTTKDL